MDRGMVEPMRDRIIYRGPNDVGTYIHRKVRLGHRRLNVIELAGSPHHNV